MKYKMIKEFPLHKGGDVFEADDIGGIDIGSVYYDDEDVEQLLKDGWIEEVDERWRPERNNAYHYVNSYGKVEADVWFDFSGLDGNRWKFGNCFKTKEEAEEARDAIAELLASRRDK